MSVTNGDQSVSYSYNEEGDLIQVVEATREQKRFSYDDRGLLVESAVYSDSGTLVSSVTITYEWDGLVTMSLQPENRTLGTYVDPQGRPKSFSQSPDSPPIVQIDLPASNGRMLIAGDQVNSLFVQHDAAAIFTTFHFIQVLSETRMDSETNTLHVMDGNGNEVVYKLGNSGEIVSLVDSGGHNSSAVFDDIVGVKEFVNPDGTKLVIDYGSDGQVSGITNPDGSKILFAYDSQDNLVSV